MVDGVAAEQPRRTAESIERRVVEPRRLANCAQCYPDRRTFAILDVAETPLCSESALIEPGGLDVRSDRPCMVAGEPAVAPRFVAAPRLEEVERKRRRLLLGRRRGCLDRLRNPPVQLTPAAIRETFVGGFADERVAKTPAAVGVGLDQLGQPPPDCVVGLDPIRERGRKQRFVEPDTKDRGVAQHRSVGGREPIDLRGNHGLDRVRQRVRRAGRAG